MINFHKLAFPAGRSDFAEHGIIADFELSQFLKDSKVVKAILLSFNPAFVLETVMKKDYHGILKKGRSLNVENIKRLTLRKACDLSEFYKLSYFKKKLSHGQFKLWGGLRYFELLSFGQKFYQKLKNHLLLFQFRNFSNCEGQNSFLTFWAKVIHLHNQPKDCPGSFIEAQEAVSKKPSKFLTLFSSEIESSSIKPKSGFFSFTKTFKPNQNLNEDTIESDAKKPKDPV